MTNDKTKWKQFVYKIGVWLAAEICLNLIGLDNIADYSEYIFAQDLDLKLKNRRTVKITEYPPQFCPQINDFCPIPGTVTKPSDLEQHSYSTKVEILNNKCQKLTETCLKIVCITGIDSNLYIT